MRIGVTEVPNTACCTRYRAVLAQGKPCLWGRQILAIIPMEGDFMVQLGKQPDTLAIIGNGFDLAHGYQTQYHDFVRHTDSVYLEQFKSCCENEKITTWYLFEDNIRLITERLFLRSMAESCDFDDNRREADRLAEVFRNIQTLLLQYLAKEVAGKSFQKKHSIEGQVGEHAIAINFNYTDTAERYFKKVFYVHGSLAEKDILLGYDYREEPCLAQFEDMRWSKRICREALAFRRLFLQNKRLPPDSKKYQELLSGLESYQHWENSGRGLDEEAQAFIPHYQTIHSFLKKYRQHPFPGLDYRAIKTVVVLGHGIEADKVYLKTLLGQCKHLDKAVIFRYDGETEESYQNKCRFFAPYCGTIQQASY